MAYQNLDSVKTIMERKPFFFCAASQILVLTSISANTPYDIGGAYAFSFHRFIAMAVSVLLLVVVGRALALFGRYGSSTGLFLFLPVCIFTISFSILFGLTALYGTSSGALHGRQTLVLLCSSSLAATILVFAYGNERHG